PPTPSLPRLTPPPALLSLPTRRSSDLLALSFEKRLFGALAVVDIREQHAPSRDLSFCIAEREAAVLNPAIGAVSSPETLRDLIGSAGGDRACEDIRDVWQILRMNRAVGTPLSQLLQGLTEILEQLKVDDVDVAGRRQECDHPGNTVHEHA